MKLPKALTTTTQLLKILMALLFVALPLLGFYSGVKYQEWVYRRLQQENGASGDVWEEVSQDELEVVSVYSPPFCPSSKVRLEGGRSELEGVTRLPFFNLPKGINPDQIYDKWAFPKFFRLGKIYFTFYVQQNMQYAIDSRAKRAGVLYASEGDIEWKILVEIKSNGGRNNPLYLWKEKDTLFLLIADDWGAGSGEGVAKLLASRDGGRSWEIQKCFSIDVGFLSSEALKGGRSFQEAYEEYRESGYGKEHGYEYLLNPKTEKCECSPQRIDPSTGKPEICHAGEACQNFQLLVINPIDISTLK